MVQPIGLSGSPVAGRRLAPLRQVNGSDSVIVWVSIALAARSTARSREKGAPPAARLAQEPEQPSAAPRERRAGALIGAGVGA
jgi:hypothetical protein